MSVSSVRDVVLEAWAVVLDGVVIVLGAPLRLHEWWQYHDKDRSRR